MAVLEAAVERLTGELDKVTSRLAALEARVGEGLSASPMASPASPNPPDAETLAEIPPELAIPDRHTLLRFVTLGGRSLMALGGAYLLRAFTEAGDAGTLQPSVGVGLFSTPRPGSDSRSARASPAGRAARLFMA